MAVTSGTSSQAGGARTRRAGRAIRTTRVTRAAVVAAAALSLAVAGCDADVTGASGAGGGGAASVSEETRAGSHGSASDSATEASGASTGAGTEHAAGTGSGGSTGGGHSHDTLHEVAAAEAPSIRMEAIPDSVGGWNIHLIVDRFRFAPENAGQEARPGEGHVHLYLDGKKIARVYGEWFHLPADGVSPGEHTLSAVLNANDHGAWAVDGTPISASAKIGTPIGDEEPEAADHTHAPGEPEHTH